MGRSKFSALGVSMQVLICVSVCAVSCMSRTPRSKGMGIFGADDRKDVSEVADEALVTLAGSVPALVEDSQLSRCGNFICTQYLPKYSLPIGKSFAKPLCPNEKFAAQTPSAFCSAVLVAPNVIATAGHCVEGVDLQSFSVVFGFSYRQQDTAGPIDLKVNQIYKATKVLMSKREYNSDPDQAFDFAFLLLDRNVEGFRPVMIDNTIGNFTQGTKIFGIGYPDGLPEKITDGAEVRVMTPARIMANWDSMKGNSGGPLFSQESKKLIAIFFANQSFQNYQYSMERDCMEATKLRQVDDDLNVNSFRFDFILRQATSEIQDAVAGIASIPPIPSVFSPMQAGVARTAAANVWLYELPQMAGQAIGEIPQGTGIEILESDFVRWNLVANTGTYPFLFAKVKVLTGAQIGKTGYLNATSIQW